MAQPNPGQDGNQQINWRSFDQLPHKNEEGSEEVGLCRSEPGTVRGLKSRFQTFKPVHCSGLAMHCHRHRLILI